MAKPYRFRPAPSPQPTQEGSPAMRSQNQSHSQPRTQTQPRPQTRTRRPGWYVVQVQTGKEHTTCGLITRVCAEWDRDQDIDGYRLLDECFSPSFHTRHKFGQEWRDVEKLLLPGYVVAVTREPDQLSRRLRQIPEFTKLLTMGETFVPLRDDERAWMEDWTTRGDRTIPISIAYKKGDKLVVTEGPLKGREGMVTRVNRKKCLAFVELDVGGKKITTKVGLAVVPEPEKATDRQD